MLRQPIPGDHYSSDKNIVSELKKNKAKHRNQYNSVIKTIKWRLDQDYKLYFGKYYQMLYLFVLNNKISPENITPCM